MATDGERNRRLRSERAAERRRFIRIKNDTAAEVTRLMAAALARIRAEVAGTPTEFQAFQLPRIQASVRQAMEELNGEAAARMGAGLAEAWRSGVDMVDRPIESGLALDGRPRIRLAAVLPEVDMRQLMAMRTFLTDRMRDITASVANRINGEIGLVAIGAQTPSKAATGITRAGGVGRGRALTIVRTELGRAFSVAGQERYAQARRVLPGLKKQWRRSGKIHSRAAHDAVDGQVREVDETFDVGGEKLRFPRDPRGSPRNTINCGCTSLPFMETWEVRQPGRQPFSDEELARSPGARLLDSGL